MSVPKPRMSDGGRDGLPCEAVDRQAIRYFFNGLPRGRRAALLRHLRRCPRCRRKLVLFRRVWVQDRQRRLALPGAG